MRTGFSLIELIITLAIMAILTTLAYPVYTQYIVAARRHDAQGALLDLAARMEQYYATYNRYTGATISVDPTTDVLASATTPEGWYRLSVSMTDTGYQLTAVPIAAQAAQDKQCTALSIDDRGVKSSKGSAKTALCWK
jgi:type IV pilus assembly protein PilE